MPIDPRIPLGVQVPPAPSPLELVQQVAQIQGIREQSEARRLAANEARQKAADAAAIRQVLTETGGDIEQALPRLRTIAPKAALELETEIETRKGKAIDALKTNFELRSKKFDFGLKIAQGMTDATSYEAGRPMLAAMSPELAQVLPETYDPAVVERLLNVGMSAKELHDTRREGFETFVKGDAREGLATIFSTARNQQDWDNTLMGARAAGAPASLLTQFGTEYSPEAVARAAQLGITPAKRAELAGQAETRQQTAAQQAAQLEVSRGHLAVAQAAERRQAAAPGGEAGAVKLSAAQQEDVATMLTVEQLAGEALGIGKQAGEFPGVGPIQGRFFPSTRGSGGTTGETLRNKIGNIAGTVAKLRGGTSFTPTEKALLETYTPSITDTDAAIATKLANLTDFIQKKRANTLRVARGEYTLPTGAGTTTTTTAPAGKRYQILKVE